MNSFYLPEYPAGVWGRGGPLPRKASAPKVGGGAHSLHGVIEDYVGWGMWNLCKLLSRMGKLLLSFLCPGAGAKCGLGVFHITAVPGRGVGTGTAST